MLNCDSKGDLQLTYIEARFLQSERDQVEEVDKLTKNEALCARVLKPEIRQLLDERFDFG